MLPTLQVPLLDAHVPGAGEEGVSIQGKGLDAVVVGRLQVKTRVDQAGVTARDVKYLWESWRMCVIKLFTTVACWSPSQPFPTE